MALYYDSEGSDELELLSVFRSFHLDNFDLGSNPFSLNASAESLKSLFMRWAVFIIERTDF
jgi:hypothetical protein